MPVMITLDALLKDRGYPGKEVAEKVGLSETQLSMFRSGKVRGIRFSTLARLCFVLQCEPGDLLAYKSDPTDLSGKSAHNTSSK